MANRKDMTLFEQAKKWWESDTAKAIATIVAVLLIPASVVAWNYATSKQPEIGTGEDTVADETASSEETPAVTSAGSETQDNGTVGQAPVASEPQNGKPAVGGISNVQKLPNTSSESETMYVVQNGDTIYSISQKVCGDNSFYLRNLRKNYLKVGSAIKVVCD